MFFKQINKNNLCLQKGLDLAVKHWVISVAHLQSAHCKTVLNHTHPCDFQIFSAEHQ